MVRPKTKSKIKQAGFTLVELLVTITIFVMLTGVVIFNQERFNSTIFLTNLSYDIALTLRQAQTYGVNIRGFSNISGSQSFVPYGVHFNTGAPNSFILFADLDATTNPEGFIETDGLFDPAGGPVISKCQIEDGCEKRTVIQKGNKIESLCVALGAAACISTNKLNVIFVRPNQEAIITNDTTGSLRYDRAEIKVTNAKADSFRTVVVQKNGVVYVKR